MESFRASKAICRIKTLSLLCRAKEKGLDPLSLTEVALLVEHNLGKVRVARSSPVFRSQERLSQTL